METLSAANATPFTATTSSRTVPTMFYTRDFVTVINPPFTRQTVLLDPRPVLIPILSCVIGFPIVAFAIICALRHRARRLRRRDQIRKLHAGIRSVTLDIPPKERISFFSGGSSPDLSLRHLGEQLDSFAYSTSSAPSRRSSKNNNHVKFVTTTAESSGGKQNGKIGGSRQEVSFWDEPSYIENGIELSEEICHSAAR